MYIEKKFLDIEKKEMILKVIKNGCKGRKII